MQKDFTSFITNIRGCDFKYVWKINAFHYF